jgi:ATP-dependent Clp protease ATP-binding subunit ClpA
MFERFTREAREAVVKAVDRASHATSGHVDTEHLLLGVAGSAGLAGRVLRQAGATEDALTEALARWDDARLLETLGIDVEEVRASVERIFGPGAWTGAAEATTSQGRKQGHLPLTADAKKALELSLREALNLRSKRIEAAHILLGLLRVGGRVTEALEAVSVDRAVLRRQLVEALQQAS